MSQTHEHSHRTNISSKSGPARVATGQERFRKEIERRIRALKGAIRQTIGENDALDLENYQSDETGVQGPRDFLNRDELEDAIDFDFDVSSGRFPAFVAWWNDATERGFLDPMDQESVAVGQHWSATHIDDAYQQGISWSDARLRESGITVEESDVAAIMRRPTHQESLRTLYARTYSELDGITDQMQTDMSRVLAEGLGSGLGPENAAREMTDQMGTLQRTRGRRIARTEFMNAHSNATGDRYQEMGVTQANIVTSDPCPQCAAFQAAGPHPIDEVKAALPIHPNCVCSAVPANSNQT